MTNPGQALGTNAAFGGRTSPNAFNDVLAAFNGRGILSGWACEPVSGMTVALGGDHKARDVAIAEDDAGNRTTVDNRSGAPVQITLEPAATVGQRIDLIVAYVQNPPTPTNKIPDNPECVSLIAVEGEVAVEPLAPTEEQIRAAITADGGSGMTAYYVVLATISIPENATDITVSEIQPGDPVGVGTTIDETLSTESENPVQNKVITKALDEINTQISGVDATLTRIDTGAGVTLDSAVEDETTEEEA